ncbi:MAG TPA: AMP-binding protein [Polyangiaceae bacterium]|nr:AMP-binding protein [Polyangiaceae bacterium]
MSTTTPGSAPWPASIRAGFSTDPEIGSGNFFHRLRALSVVTDEPLIWAQDAQVDPRAPSGLSVGRFGAIVDRVAAFHHARGVRRRDVVPLYAADGLAPFVHFLALSGLGAIPALLNGRLEPSVAASFIRRVAAHSVVTDAERSSSLRQALGRPLELCTLSETLAERALPLPLQYPFRHADEDPVLLTHSSGTTGEPKAVLLQHQQFFAAVRFRLRLPIPQGAERVLSALPTVHNSSITLLSLALLNGTPLMTLSKRDSSSVLRTIGEFRPSLVAAFPETHVELCEEDLSQHDLSSVAIWYNSGDAAHEVHVRKLVAYGNHVAGRPRKLQPGSHFVDGLGSSEMGHSLFHVTRGPSSANYARCVGKPMPFVDAAVLDEEGVALPVNAIGRLGVRSPTVTQGYWNDSELTWRSRLNGYWLTGDLVYRDDDGYFYHLDRVTDAIQTEQGVLYSCQAEELLLSRLPNLADCSIVGVPSGGGPAHPVALLRLAPGVDVNSANLLREVNEVLTAARMPNVSRAIASDHSDLPIGVTGKVKKRTIREQLAALA